MIFLIFFFFCEVHNGFHYVILKQRSHSGFVGKKWEGNKAQLKNPGKVARRQQEMQWSGKIIRNSNLTSSLYRLIILVVITLKRN